jgi:hypothetical protein
MNLLTKTYLILLAAEVFLGTASAQIPANRLYPKIKTATKQLVVIDLKNESIDAQVAVCVLQGIVNRSSMRKIYVTNTYCLDNHGGWNNNAASGKQVQMGETWLKQILSKVPQQQLTLDSRQRNPGMLAAINEFRSYIKGLIIYDPELEDATIEAATTIAGQTDGVVVSPEIAMQLKSFNFPVLKDLRELHFKNNYSCLQWLKTNYFAKANKQVAFTWSHMSNGAKSWGAANKDYVVANKLFTFYLNIEDEKESHQYREIISAYPNGTPIMGWTDERFADKVFSDEGHFMVPMIAVENLSVMSSFPSVSGKQSVPKVYPIKKNAVYIAFYVPDGDNLLHTMDYEPYTILKSPNYGKIPLTWIVNPGIVDLAPLTYNWLLSKFNNSGQEMGAMMSDGSPSSDRYKGFAFYCDFARYYLKQSGIVTLKQMAEGEAVSWKVQPLVLNSGYAGTESRGIGAYEYHMDGRTFHVGSIHISEHDVKKIIRDAPSGKPLFLNIFAGTAAVDVPTLVQNFTQELINQKDDRNYYFVRSMDLAETYKAYEKLKSAHRK